MAGSHTRYRAPSDDGGILADPPFVAIGQLLAENCDRLHSIIPIAGVPLVEFREKAKNDALAGSKAYHADAGEPIPSVAGGGLLLAGHQPDFFHPGVWVKNFALSGLAARHGRTPLNLIVDTDVAKNATLAIPNVDGTRAFEPENVARELLPLGVTPIDLPCEEVNSFDSELLASMPDRLQKIAQNWRHSPIALAVWPIMVRECQRGTHWFEAVCRTRRAVERQWGIVNFELPVSILSETRAFVHFVFALFHEHARFANAYNTSIRSYRLAHGLRSHNHPATDLDTAGSRVEVPFWIWNTDNPQRSRLFVERVQGGFELSSNRIKIGVLADDVDGFYAGWQTLRHSGWKIRPRALILTLFSRVCLGDGFIHGIGGGKYDEVTDGIIRRFFGLEPPHYAVVSATLRLPIPRFPTTSESMHRAERQLRDLDWNPQQFPAARVEQPELVRAKGRLTRSEPTNKSDRRNWFRTLHRMTLDLRPAVAEERARVLGDIERSHRELAANIILGSREYSWLLFPEDQLRRTFAKVRESVE